MLKNHQLLDTPPEPELDRLAQLLATALDVPISFVSLIDKNRQWNKARMGLNVEETPRGISFCAHAVAANAPLIVNDATKDPRFADNPQVTGDPKIRFYAGFPIRSSKGHPLGTLCAIDRRPRRLTKKQRALAEALAGVVQSNLQLRYRLQGGGRGQQLRMFVEMAVHDLKNPLFLVVGLASLIQETPARTVVDPKIVSELLESAHLLNSRLLSILDLVAGVDGDGMKLDLTPVSVPQLMKRILRQGSAAASIAGKTFIGEVAPDCGEIIADAGVLERLLENLIQNAVKFAPPGGNIQVQVSGNKECTGFSVMDNGRGVAAKERKRIFEPFVSATGQPGRGSLGLGLAFCKAAVERHGGKIWVENRPAGAGARFVACIPNQPR